MRMNQPAKKKNSRLLIAAFYTMVLEEPLSTAARQARVECAGGPVVGRAVTIVSRPLRKQETGQEKRCLGRLDLLLLHKAENVESLNRAIGKEAVHRVLDVSVNLKHRAQFGDDQ